MNLLTTVAILLILSFSAYIVNGKCKKGYRMANLFYGVKPLNNYLVSAVPDNNPENALKRVKGESTVYRGNKGRDASYEINVRGYRAHVDSKRLCLETKCVRSISGTIEGAYSAMKTRRDKDGNLHLLSDIGTALSHWKPISIKSSAGWIETCHRNIGAMSKLTLRLRVAKSDCRPMIRNLFMKACKKKKQGPVYCKDPYSTRLYKEGSRWDVTEFVSGSCGASCSCLEDGDLACISSACPPDTEP